MKKIAVLLSGCGVYDGSEIQETVFTLLAIAQQGAEAMCFAPNIEQHHVINHTNGEELSETRNVLVEAARIARGNIQDLKEFSVDQVDAIVLVGGFGTAKNLTKWAFEGPNGAINPQVSQFIQDTVKSKKPILAMCMGPVVVAKALEGTDWNPQLTVGTTADASPYDIQAISDGMKSIGATTVMKSLKEVSIDEELKIVSVPCYMMEGNIQDIHEDVQQGVKSLFKFL